ncbi:hypothetical protein [Alicyclobacillus macrosporangiidus]|uniref:Uncharacterized protein n=1 Tax=Alicyclobacillus macrosporangiidus TaxID=392015 RepID=A0A1I7KA20_9BACL|nr:hypothetical protein [Alicyclobacillus macrosporangiidus]SFU94283.1 hypothetical protein SAMN05421543_114109 [Alicyclobacillus macrosporangiidus]
MPTTLLAVVALALIILSAWVWMNVLWVRRARERRAADRSAQRADAPDADTGDADKERGAASASHLEAAAGDDATRAVAAADAEGDGWDPRPTQVEVLQDGDTGPRRRVFERLKLPFVLNGAGVPAFTSEPWMACFTRLTEDARVLGWIAFQGETLGAADRDYEPGFLDVLRTYRRTVERVREEVGLSHVVETSITGDEGKVWFLTGIDDTWFALFVERETDVDELSRRLLSAVTEVAPQA